MPFAGAIFFAATFSDVVMPFDSTAFFGASSVSVVFFFGVIFDFAFLFDGDGYSSDVDFCLDADDAADVSSP